VDLEPYASLFVNRGRSSLYLTDTEVSKITGRSVNTLRNERSQGRGMPYVKLSRSVRYRIDDVIEFMEAHKVLPEDRSESSR